MEPERWRRINELFHAALERDSGSREAFIDEACASDPALRTEVLSLLQMHSGPGIIDRPAVEADPGLLLTGEDDPLIGRRLGPYEVTGLLGRGGMGIVYLGQDTRLQRPVAIKALPPALTHNDQLRARLRREAMAAGALSHPGIATVFALEEFDGQLYVVQEYVPGRTLRATMKIREGRLAVAEIVSMALDIARALAAAHAHGVLHRDLKPENVLHTPDGGIKVVDFGLARFEPGAAIGGAETLTRPGALPGTPGYMAPEVLRGDPVDARADQFSFGVLLYELVAGEHPFEGTDDIATVARILETEPSGPGPARPECPEPLVRVITKCLAKAPRDRYRTTAELVAALEAVRDAVEAVATDAGAAADTGVAGEAGAKPAPDVAAAPSAGAGSRRVAQRASSSFTPYPAGPASPPRAPEAASAGDAAPGADASPPPTPASTGIARDGAIANLRWWWQFHQVAVSVVYALMLYPMWRAREWLPAPWGLVTFMAAVAVVGAVVNLRLHLWFTARVYPAQLAAQRRASALWKRLLDTAFAVLLLSVAATIAPSHTRWAAFFIVMAISSALSARVMEPATTRAAFPDD